MANYMESPDSVIQNRKDAGCDSETLADAFIKGAEEAGHEAKKTCLYDKRIEFCKGCNIIENLCNTHNPTGMIWSREELGRIGELCTAYHVRVLSDEIHCDLTEPGYSYIPFASVSEECAQNSVTCMAPTKTFNLAGLQTAAVMVPNKELRHKMERLLDGLERLNKGLKAYMAGCG